MSRLTNCCGASFYEETDLCTRCKEHADALTTVITDRNVIFELEDDQIIIQCQVCAEQFQVDNFDKYVECPECTSELYVNDQSEVDYEDYEE